MTYQTSFTAPHYKAAQAGQAILDAGGTASEAMVAAAAMVTVQYPHMNSIGGDGFWLICKVGEKPVAIDACGAAALNINVESYRQAADELPDSGGKSAFTMAGTVAGWQQALTLNASNKTLNSLLQPAIDAAEKGIEVTQSLVDASEKTFDRLSTLAPFAEHYLKQGKTLQVGDSISNPALAKTFKRLAEFGLDEFYRGELAEEMAKELAQAGSPLTLDDFHAYQATVQTPLTVEISKGHLYNLDAPTQGLASLLILAIYDKLVDHVKSESDHIHLLVEASKQAFIIRDQQITDPAYLSEPLQNWLSDDVVEACAKKISFKKALPWPHLAKTGDTVWMGATDQYGTMVSFIQSIYWEFGSGVVLPSSGITWSIRGKSFTLDANHHNVLKAGKKPFHTLNPAYAEFNDGRRMVYGSMGGEGQPQTQACLFSRHIYQAMNLTDAVASPRWLLGRTWGDSSNNLRLENQLYQTHGAALQTLGHDVTPVTDNNELMGHAGAILLNKNGKAAATSDPRSDGQSLLGENHDS
ncbi:gamma-glutamyltransferase family protein [Psychromonas sp. RZ22]|uniref:gamma-glutamyltransferase family protein n=1 Tax=Psychromonas algarum TaxID=2555643 RepID=UPI001068C6A2|nr:gamma-glutamyltransferase family protein [Psychromonas sp. RZ22]TEW54459.1 gamma-glutamyltransferase family protein [Psychromonas sp. RZ22]